MDLKNLIVDRNSEEEFANVFKNCLNAGCSLIHVRTREVARAVASIRRRVLTGGALLYKEWNVLDGFVRYELSNFYDPRIPGSGMASLADALNEVKSAYLEYYGLVEAGQEANVGIYDKVYLFVNPQFFVDRNPAVHQLMQEFASYLGSSNIVVIWVTPDVPLPEDIAMHMTAIDFGLPGYPELEARTSVLFEESVDPDILEIDQDGIQRVSVAGGGMTLQEYETGISRAIVEKLNEDGVTKVNTDDLVTAIRNFKTEIIKKNDLLELLSSESMSNVGGMENLKDWVGLRAACYSSEAQEFGIEPPKGIVLVGVPGCLAGDTEVVYKRGARSSGRSITIEELYKKFNGIPTSTRPWVDLTMPTYLHSLAPDGYVFYNRIISVIDAGVKPVIILITDSGDTLTLTEDHPVCTPGGHFVAAGDLKEGDEVLLRGSMRSASNGGRNLSARPPRTVVSTKYHPNGGLKSVDGYLYNRVAKARLVVEAHMNGVDYDEFVHALKHNRQRASEFRFLPVEYDVHHIDEDTTNDDLSNLMVLTKSEHAKTHSKTENLNVEYVVSAKIVDIKYPKAPIQTYDIQMDMPANNFVANNFIVHNTGKSLVAKAVSSEFGIPLVRLDFSKVFNSLVGSSEARMRTALAMIEAMAPCVCFADEIDKGLGGIAGGGGDAGTSMRVLGTFLTWLQECKYPVFTIVTANNVNGLPPELLRRGRFDAIFSTTLPTADERREVLRIHFERRNRKLSKLFTEAEIQQYLIATDGYVPAEIEATVKDALILGFNSEDKELTIEHLLTAARGMVPLSRSHAAAINAMVEWSAHNAIPASYTDAERRARSSSRRVPRSTGSANRVLNRKIRSKRPPTENNVTPLDSRRPKKDV